MENSWQGKCSIPWPSSSPSPQFQSQGSRSQIDMTASHYMHPFVAHENGSIERAIRQEPTLLSSPNLGSVKSGKPELGNSFLALLSGPSNQLHFDYQQLLNSRSVSATNLPIHDSGIVVTGPSPGVSGPLTGNESMGNRAELSPFVVSRQQSTSTCNRVALSHDNLQMAGMNFHGSDSTKQSLLNSVQSNETGMDISFLRRGWLNNTIPLNTRQQHTINFDASPKISQEAKFSVSDLASSSIRGHPRVFCLNTSGDLLLSDVGRLGVICLCHNLHMSVANFCEHSGSCAVNPGDVVRLESGETIGQWRKLHFTKFGLRVPDDNTGWDWADGSSQLSESAKHKVTMQCISKNSGIFQPLDPSGGKTRFDQHWNDLVSPSNPYKGHPVLENPGKKVIQNARQRNSLEGCNALLKNFVGTTHGILPTMADNQTIQTSKIAFDNERKNYGYQSNVQYIDSINRGENSFFSNQNFGNIISLDKGADVSRCDGSRETFIMDRDTIHSNIELRLGQPSQQSHTIVGPIPSSVRPQGISTLSDPHNTQFYGQLIQRAVNPRVTEESRRNLRCAPPDSLVTKHREKESQLNAMSHALRSLNAAENASLDQLKGLPPTGHFSISEGTVLQAAENNLNNCEHFMPRIFGGDSHLVKCGLGDFPRNIINGMERKLEMQGMGLSNHFDFGKGSGALADGSSCTPANTVLHRPTNSTMSSSYIPTSLPPATSVCFSATNPLYLSNLKSALQNKKSVDFGQHLLDENLRLLALRRIVEMSKQEHAITEMNRDQGRVHCPLALQMQKKASKETLVTSVLRQGSCAMGSHDASEVAARTLQSCCNHCLGGSFEKLTCRSGSNKSCNFATSTHVMSLYPKESEVRDVHGTDEQPLLRLGRSTNNCTNDFGECVRCNHKEPNPCFIGNCTCALHSNCLTGSCVSRMENLANASKENIASIISKASNMLFSPDVKNNMAPKGKKNLPGRCESVEMHDLMKSGCHSLQWREVPNKVTENCEATCIERPEEVNNAKETIEDQLADTAAKRSTNGIIQETESLKEQQMSNICSANSAPAVTEFSVEGTVDTRKMRFMRNLVVDEGSGIEKCYSSDDAPDSGRWTPTLTGNIDLVSTSTLPTQSSHDRNEPMLTKLVRIKKAKNRTAGSCAVREKIHFQQISRDSNTEKKKRVIKWKRLDATLPSSDSSRQYDPPNYNRYSESHFHSCRGVEKPLQIALGKQKSSLKRKRSTPSSNNILSHKPNLHGFDRHKREWGDANETQSSGSDDIVETPKLLPEMKAKRDFSKDAREQFPKYELNFIDNGKAAKYGSMCCSEHLSEQGVGTRDRHRRPVVCDNYGIITDGKSGVLPKPAKIVSLRLILKNARRCSTTGNAKEEVPIVPSASEKTEACFSKKDGWSDAFSPLKKGRNDEGHVPSKHGISKKCSSAWMKPSMNVSKEVRKRSLYELTRMEANIEKLACISYLEEKEHSEPIEEACSTRISPQNVLFDASNGKKSSPSKFYSKKASKYVQHTGVRSSAGSCLKSAEYSQGHLGETLRVNDKRHVIKGRKRQAFLLDADAFCCVCGSSNKDDFNCLLECNRCLIRVHQACYGVSKVPKGRWCCRPCRSNFENIVCVLCGYEGGAMTQALRSREIVKSLLQEWKIGSESMSSAHPSETLQDGLNLLNTSSRGEASSDAVSITRIRNIDALHRDPVKLNLQNDAISARNSNNLGDCFQVHNTITAGVLDPGVKQWVHMVCGLWMPGTRCPNVDTMSAFDVSGVSRSRKNVVCSICNRRGGSCIQCRVADCSVLFHPWCAHQKGLLQSEIEGIDNEKVGFYGRCVLHATFSGYCPGDTHLLDGKLEETHENRESTCARTEGYKGRKRDKGFRLNLHGQFSNGGGCLVPQEQINAWLHINGQKSSTRGPVKPPVSDIEYDCRQEYARYKQAKGWKHLVVYKSGIHALGLYTSQYISRGAMVVEYVGEIVGLRVADKREAEYQSGRRVQYKSACYFFRIDKEHIIDATRKGGIARFVNHSCLPNCVAKVISVRNEKKVVFFAERDINPGEEITYDYNFNHEDEGKKIPCFCNSKNCRLYLN